MEILTFKHADTFYRVTFYKQIDGDNYYQVSKYRYTDEKKDMRSFESGQIIKAQSAKLAIAHFLQTEVYYAPA